MKSSTLRICVLFAFALLANGCSSMRFSTTLKPQPDPGPVFGEARFCISEVKVKENIPPWAYGFIMAAGPMTAAPAFKPDEVAALRTTSQKLYPSVFSDDILSIPLTVKVDRINDTTPDFLLFIFPGLLGFLPVYEGRSSAYTVTVDAPVPTVRAESVAFTRRDAAWTTLIHPLGLFPVVGRSSIPRRAWVGATMPGDVANTGKELTYSSLSEALRLLVSTLDRGAIDQVLEQRQARLQNASAHGQTFWLWQGVINGTLHVWVSPSRPTYANPNTLDTLVFIPNPDGVYSPVLMRTPPYFTEISVRREKGQAVAEARAVTPTLSQLLEIVKPRASGAAALEDDALIAAVTPALVCAKNTELPMLVVQASVDKRVAILNAIEQRLLEAQQHLVVLNGRAEDAVRQGQNAADFRQKTARIQAYMSVLAEIKNLLIQS